MKLLIIFVIVNLIGSALGGGNSQCEPFVSKFHEFDQIYLNLLNNMEEYSSSQSTDPVLATTFSLGLTCEVNSAIIFAAKAISRLSGVNQDTIVNIINGTESQPYVQPLDCITNDLIYLKEKYLNIFKNLIPAIAADAESASTPFGGCAGVVVRIGTYLPSALTIASSKASTIATELSSFSSIGMSDLYKDYIKSVCIWDIIGSALGAVLNADASAAMAYIHGETTDLPYPFSCFKIFIDYLKDSFLQQVLGALDGNFTTLSFPSLF